MPGLLLFRRKVKKIISWGACSRDPTDEAAWQSGSGACVDLCFGFYNGPDQGKKPNALNNKLLQVNKGIRGIIVFCQRNVYNYSSPQMFIPSSIRSSEHPGESGQPCGQMCSPNLLPVGQHGTAQNTRSLRTASLVFLVAGRLRYSGSSTQPAPGV